MKLFTINDNGKLKPYSQRKFAGENFEQNLEQLLENNPEFFFDDDKILIIGKEVRTNLDTYIDLLGVDESGNTVVIELKRGKMPRETLAQVLEYASFVETLNYNQLNEIFKNYLGSEDEGDILLDYHKQYFNKDNSAVAFNKSVKLIILAEEISDSIRQTAAFLRKRGIDIYCIEFKYFKTSTGEKIISREIVVGAEKSLVGAVKSSSLPRLDEEKLFNYLDNNAATVFRKIIDFAKEKNFRINWGSTGFTVNVEVDDTLVLLLACYSNKSKPFAQSVYTWLEKIIEKVKDGDEVAEYFAQKLG